MFHRLLLLSILLLFCNLGASWQGGGPGGGPVAAWAFISPTNFQSFNMNSALPCNGSAAVFPAPAPGSPNNFTVDATLAGSVVSTVTGLSTDDGFIGTWSASVPVPGGPGLSWTKGPTYIIKLHSGVPSAPGNFEDEVWVTFK